MVRIQSQAAAVHRHAVTGSNLFRDMRRSDLQLRSVLRCPNLEHVPDFFDQTCEHIFEKTKRDQDIDERAGQLKCCSLPRCARRGARLV